MKVHSLLPKGILKVDSPDHPFAYDGPDFLLSDSSGLIAVFCTRKSENKNHSKLLSRLSNSIIVYPAETKMVFLADDNTSRELQQKFAKGYFDRLIEAKDLKKANYILRDQKSSLTINSIRNIQKKLFNIQSQIQNNNLEHIKKYEFEKNTVSEIKELSNKAKYIDRLTQKNITARANIFEFGNLVIGSKRLTSSVSDMIELKPYYEFSILSNFIIDNGVPYFNSLTRKALNLSSIPSIKSDPIKPIRVASLLGWYLASTNKISELVNRIPPHFRNS